MTDYGKLSKRRLERHRKYLTATLVKMRLLGTFEGSIVKKVVENSLKEVNEQCRRREAGSASGSRK